MVNICTIKDPSETEDKQMNKKIILLTTDDTTRCKSSFKHGGNEHNIEAPVYRRKIRWEKVK